jgi:hypothetical protein
MQHGGLRPSRMPGSMQAKKKPAVLQTAGFYMVVPKRGLEPPRLSALVPETSASTNSATWASQEACEYTSGIVHIRCCPLQFHALGRFGVADCVSLRMFGCKFSNFTRAKKKPAVLWTAGLYMMVPKRGLEPPRLSALVPETSASTNSATWASQETSSIQHQKMGNCER